MKKTIEPTRVGSMETKSSVMIRFFKGQQLNFMDVIAQMAKGDTLTLPDGSSTIDMKTNMIGASLAVNKWVADQEAATTQLMKLFNFEKTLADQLAQIT